LHLLSRHSTIWVTPPALFCFSYFSDRVLPFTWTRFRPWSSYLCLPCIWNCLLRWGGLDNFLLVLASNYNLSYLSGSWDYGHMPPCPALIFLNFKFQLKLWKKYDLSNQSVVYILDTHCIEIKPNIL
jgi:hypothetical protein